MDGDEPVIGSHLTAREYDVYALIGRGFTNGQIADELGLTFATAKWYVSQVIARCGVASREEVAALWRAENRASQRVKRGLRAAFSAQMVRFATATAAISAAGVACAAIVIAAWPGGTIGAGDTQAPADGSAGSASRSATPAANAGIVFEGTRQLDTGRLLVLYHIEGEAHRTLFCSGRRE